MVSPSGRKYSSIRHLTSTNTFNVLNEFFSRFSTPQTLVNDNGTQFTGREFKDFCTSLSIDHITASVYHSRSNGQAGEIHGHFQ